MRKLRLKDSYTKYKKNKLRLHEVASSIQDFYFLVKFGLVLIYILKVSSKNSSSILLRKNMFNLLLAFFFWKACSFSSFLCRSLETVTSIFLSKSSSEIYLSPIINCWGRIFTLYLTWGSFSLVCVLSLFFSFFLSFFFLFLSVFSLTSTNNSQDSREGIKHKHSFSSSKFLHFCLIDLFVITRQIVDEICSP